MKEFEDDEVEVYCCDCNRVFVVWTEPEMNYQCVDCEIEEQLELVNL